MPARSSALALLLLIPLRLSAQTLPDTKPLETKEDLAKVMVEGIGKYLDRETAGAAKKREAVWQLDFSSPEARQKSIEPHRQRLKKMIGLVDDRVPVRMDYVHGTREAVPIAEAKLFRAYQMRWTVLTGVDAEGLLLEPKETALGTCVFVPDADWTPEMFAGLAQGLDAEAQVARRLAEEGFRVFVPAIVDRKSTWSGSSSILRWTNQPHREFLYRMSYQMGRHVLGYEVQRILAIVDWCHQEDPKMGVLVAGYGEGGLLALLSAAADPRLKACWISGYFGDQGNLFEQPIYRNLWGVHREFGDGELAAMVNGFVNVFSSHWPSIGGPPPVEGNRRGAAPGGFKTPALADLNKELARRNALLTPVLKRKTLGGLFSGVAEVEKGTIFTAKLNDDTFGARKTRPSMPPKVLAEASLNPKRQFDQLVNYTQNLLPEASAKRQAFVWNKLDTSSLEKLQKSQEPLRDYFREEIIGNLPKSELPMNPRTRIIYETPKFKGYEVTLDLYEDVNCYGILLVPNDIKPGEKRPVVVCQHGLEGRPTDVCDPTKKTKYYNSFGAQLAERGYIVFAPQNPYIFGNDFRQLVRKANPLKLTLYSFIVRQHERILDWLCTLPFVDGARIAYYGLSYGGKVAMRIPILVGRYAVVICSGDFNEWIWKNITLDWGGSYMFSPEYEMYEFDLGNTFNYAEMAALIAPRPFMVERGHNDGVGLDEYVAFEYAKVRRFYAKLGIPERTEIEFFNGGHEINGQGTFRFLDRHLNFRPPLP